VHEVCRIPILIGAVADEKLETSGDVVTHWCGRVPDAFGAGPQVPLDCCPKCVSLIPGRRLSGWRPIGCGPKEGLSGGIASPGRRAEDRRSIADGTCAHTRRAGPTRETRTFERRLRRWSRTGLAAYMW